MPTVSRTFSVRPPPDLVVNYLQDYQHAEQWDPGTQKCERIDSGPVAEVAYWHSTSKILGFTTELTYELEELTDRKVVFVGENQSSRTIDTITVDVHGTGSIIIYVADLEMQGTAKLLNPVMKMMLEKRVGDIEKQMIEVLNKLVTAKGQSGGASR